MGSRRDSLGLLKPSLSSFHSLFSKEDLFQFGAKSEIYYYETKPKRQFLFFFKVSTGYLLFSYCYFIFTSCSFLLKGWSSCFWLLALQSVAFDPAVLLALLVGFGCSLWLWLSLWNCLFLHLLGSLFG
ncbi:unnamed protein product [Citrullus colocynthis]|uniref:Uncharacterized protein n=1 Tax=Citrullus colocynthis TaxID=252529 RepID=A0ABP0XMC1_9ROSI